MNEPSMSANCIQFQHGMSIPEYIYRFGTNAQRAEAVQLGQFPQIPRCPRCDAADHHVVGRGTRK